MRVRRTTVIRNLLVMFIRIQGLVGHFVALDSLEEILHDALSVPLGVVWAGHLHILEWRHFVFVFTYDSWSVF